jgi:hypothetical protein
MAATAVAFGVDEHERNADVNGVMSDRAEFPSKASQNANCDRDVVRWFHLVADLIIPTVEMKRQGNCFVSVSKREEARSTERRDSSALVVDNVLHQQAL